MTGLLDLQGGFICQIFSEPILPGIVSVLRYRAMLGRRIRPADLTTASINEVSTCWNLFLPSYEHSLREKLDYAPLAIVIAWEELNRKEFSTRLSTDGFWPEKWGWQGLH